MAPLNVIIIGAGIAGLVSAIILRHNGHKVTLLEKSKFQQEVGAAILVGPNVSGTLEHFGFEFEKSGANLCKGMVKFGEDGQVQRSVDFTKIAQAWKNPWYMIHRHDLHGELKRLAFSAEGQGPIPELVLESEIVRIDCNAGIVELNGGKTFQGDAIIGADGNRSVSRLQINPDAQLKPWGKTSYRWLSSTEALLADPETKDIFTLEGYFGEFMGDDRRVVFYPCREYSTMNVVAFVPDSEQEVDDPDGELQDSKAVVQRTFRNFFNGAQKTLSYAPNNIKVWKLYDMDVMDNWLKGRLALIGDAAHPFLPFLGQGGSMAMEDASCIGAVLPADTPASDVPKRLELYQQIQHERATAIQEGSRINGADSDKRPKTFDFGKVLAMCHDHDEWENSKAKLEEWLQH